MVGVQTLDVGDCSESRIRPILATLRKGLVTNNLVKGARVGLDTAQSKQLGKIIRN